MTFGRLTKVELRDYWQHEALDFTTWLAEPENMDLLSDEVGIEIGNPLTEEKSGAFKVDILAEEKSTGSKIIIENQLEKSDHSHIGQLITYAAGHKATYVIWIVRDVREEHRSAIDWLNDHTDEMVNFFLVRIELWQIGDSIPAPKFVVISKPNEWQRSLHSDFSSAEQTATKARQFEFWQQFTDYAKANCPDLRLRAPKPQHWNDISFGHAECYISLTVDSRSDTITCQIYIPNSKELFHALHSVKDEIEVELKPFEPISWLELPNQKASRISATHDFCFADSSTWGSAIEWLAESAIKFKTVFTIFIKEKRLGRVE